MDEISDDDKCYNCECSREMHVFPLFDGGVMRSNTACGNCTCEEFEVE